MGWRSSDSPRLPQVWPGFQCHMWVEFVIGSHLAQRFFSGFSGFPSSTKTIISKFRFDQDRGPA